LIDRNISVFFEYLRGVDIEFSHVFLQAMIIALAKSVAIVNR